MYAVMPLSLLQFHFSYLVSSVAIKKPSSEASSQFCLCLLITGMALVLMVLALACKALPLVIWTRGAACWNNNNEKKNNQERYLPENKNSSLKWFCCKGQPTHTVILKKQLTLLKEVPTNQKHWCVLATELKVF